LPSHSENFGLVIAEAMAHGIAPIATNMTPWSALNANGCGFCVPWEEFGAAVRRATSEPPKELAARGVRAREWVLREFSWERSARELAAFYGTLRKSLA
jgi:glycosyltransferase involved in cell wall biosynthesis